MPGAQPPRQGIKQKSNTSKRLFAGIVFMASLLGGQAFAVSLGQGFPQAVRQSVIINEKLQQGANDVKLLAAKWENASGGFDKYIEKPDWQLFSETLTSIRFSLNLNAKSPQLRYFLQTDPIGYIDSANLYQAFGNNPINFMDPYGQEIDWGYFLGKTGHDLWNVASFGTLGKVESQENLGSWGGVLQSTGSAAASVSNTISMGLQDEIYYTQMNEGAGVKNILKGTLNSAVNLTPINEFKTILSSDADAGQKISAAFIVISKGAGYAIAIKGYQQAKASQNASYYRYVGEKELQAIKNSGEIPNVNADMTPKDIYYTDRFYKTAGRAKTHLQLRNKPTYRVEIDPENVINGTPIERINPSDNPQWGLGGGTQGTTKSPIRVVIKKINKLKGGGL